MKVIVFFCPGNEDSTPKEITRWPNQQDWQIRVFPNKYPVIDNKNQKHTRGENSKFINRKKIKGVHEIIVESREHNAQMSDLGLHYLKQVLVIYFERLKKLKQQDSIKYVAIFKNHGERAGASLKHTHTQIVAYSKIPAVIQAKEQVCKQRSCGYCEIIKYEKKHQKRVGFENQNFIAITPFAAKYAYEIWILPKKHLVDFAQFNQEMLIDLAAIMHKIFKKITQLNCDYNMIFQYGVKDLHVQIIFTPRIDNFAGFEIATGTIINSVFPEEAAYFYAKDNISF
ncbi:MAG: DUF4931 domain-containing protein [Candidatus Moranbacteria bacterium]|nr:DUF4931 domain-containing protein [Candidatus Moranbacteria bacterium]